jgi:hypothetical protein
MLDRHGKYFNGWQQRRKTLCNQLHTIEWPAILYATSCVLNVGFSIAGRRYGDRNDQPAWKSVEHKARKANSEETIMQVTQLSDAARHTLATWHQLLERNAMEELDPLLSDRVVFRSPVAHTPYPGKAAIKLVLKTVNTVFENFRYHRSFVSDDGRSIVLEFSAEISGKALKGIDMLRFDEEGRIEEFEVMVRPMSGLQALAAAMGAKLAPASATLTGKDVAA